MELVFTYNPLQNGRSTSSNRTIAYLKAYNEWTYKMVIEKHYTLTIQQIIKKLHVSDSWIRTKLCTAISYIKVTPTRLKELGLDENARLLFNKQELRNYLTSVCVFTRQTIVKDFAKIAKENNINIIDIDSLSRDANRRRNKYGKISCILLDRFESNYENVDETKRADYPEIPIPSFDFWDYNIKFASDYPNREQAYRDFFVKGYIKIGMFGKSLFVLREDLEKINYPFTIQYQK